LNFTTGDTIWTHSTDNADADFEELQLTEDYVLFAMDVSQDVPPVTAYVVCLHRHDGSLNWKVPYVGQVYNFNWIKLKLYLAGNQVIVMTYFGFYGLDLTTGSTIWSFANSSNPVSAWTIDDTTHTLFVTDYDNFFAYDLNNHKMLWQLPPSPYGLHWIYYLPDQHQLVIGGDWILIAYDVETRKQTWNSTTTTGFFTGVSFAIDGIIVIAWKPKVGTERGFKAYDLVTGKLLWNWMTTLPGFTSLNLAAYGNSIYWMDEAFPILFELSPVTGKITNQWVFYNGIMGTNFFQLLFYGDVVVVGSCGETLCYINQLSLKQ